MSQTQGQAHSIRSQSSQSKVAPNYGEAFKTALIQGRIIEIDRYLEAGIDINQQFADGSLALNIAIQKADMPAISRLIEHDAKLDIKDAYNQTPLALAINQQNYQLIDFLLLNGASANFAPAGQQKPIVLAIVKQDHKIVEKLIEYGASEAKDDHCVVINATLYGTTAILKTITQYQDRFALNKKNKNGETALHIAADRALDQQVAILLAAKANPKLRDCYQDTPATSNSRQIFAYDGHQNQDTTKTQSSSAEIISFKDCQNSQELKILDSHSWGGKINLDEKTQRRQLPSRLQINRQFIEAELEEYFNIFEAIHFGRLDRVTELSAQKTNFTSKNTDGDTPLTYAIRQQKTQIVELLLQSGANPNAASNLELTPLIIAINEDNTEIVKLLLKEGANPRLTGYQDITPLFVAAMQNKPEMIEILFAHLELNLSDINDLNELAHNASQNNNETICNIIDMKILELSKQQISEVRLSQSLAG